jgi:hypothetical protein
VGFQIPVIETLESSSLFRCRTADCEMVCAAIARLSLPSELVSLTRFAAPLSTYTASGAGNFLFRMRTIAAVAFIAIINTKKIRNTIVIPITDINKPLLII